VLANHDHYLSFRKASGWASFSTVNQVGYWTLEVGTYYPESQMEEVYLRKLTFRI
jgi:hypothetical protein